MAEHPFPVGTLEMEDCPFPLADYRVVGTEHPLVVAVEGMVEGSFLPCPEDMVVGED